MTKYQIGLGTDNRIDLCGHCDEAWLDKGEWALLKQLDVHDKLPELFTDAWQTNIRKTRQQEHWRAYFEKLIGKDDFAQVEQFKLWLDDHKKIDEIKHYLNARLEM